MKYAEVQFVSWDRTYFLALNEAAGNVAIGQKVVVALEWGEEIAQVVGLVDITSQPADSDLVEFVRLANDKDTALQSQLYGEEKEALDFCHQEARRFKLPMKLVDAHFSLQKKRLAYAFIAQGRVDFRELLREITKRYRGNIRLQQIGVRDEARLRGDVGPCGYRLCCQTHLQQIGNVTTGMAETQKIANRGSDRLSGSCGRLKCCLAFENNGYQAAVK